MAGPVPSRQFVLARRPAGLPQAEDFSLVDADLPPPADGEVRVRVSTFSVDPYMRGRMRADAGAPWTVGYDEPWALEEPLEAIGIGTVEATEHPAFDPSDIVRGRFVWGEHCVVDGDGLEHVPDVDPQTAALSVVGMPGRTAYFGLFSVGDTTPGDTVVVSAAAGAVGSAAVQLAGLAGCRVVGIAGSDEKTAYVTDELGADAAINYRTDDVRAAIAAACPGGVDVYFDNVGGPITDAVLAHLADRARVVVCGQVALYNGESVPTGPRHAWKLIQREARMEGFSVGSFRDRYDEADGRLAAWYLDGQLTYRETVTEGLENAPEAFAAMLTGDKIGKQLVAVDSAGAGDA